MIWLVGDSIFRGLALGRAPAEYTPQEIEAEPLWPLHCPASTLNLMAGEEIAVTGPASGLPKPENLAACRAELAETLESGRIRPGRDQVVFLDIGRHAPEPDMHREQWLELRRTATAKHAVDLFMCTGFDALAELRSHKKALNGEPVASYTHDARFNAAVVQAATAPGPFAGRTRIIDLAASIDAFRVTAAEFGGSPYHSDAIHLNIWGQLRLCAEIARAVAPHKAARVEPVRQLIEATWPAAAASSPAPDLQSALALVDAALAVEATAEVRV